MNTNQKSEHLTRYQKNALEAVIKASTLDDLRKKLAMRPSTLKRWLQNQYFCDQLIRHIEIARQITGVLMVRSQPDAAVCLNDLLESQIPETARKACADILKQRPEIGPPQKNDQPKSPPVAVTDPVECARLYKLCGIVDPSKKDDRNNE